MAAPSFYKEDAYLNRFEVNEGLIPNNLKGATT